jgi:hypothetical protein
MKHHCQNMILTNGERISGIPEHRALSTFGIASDHLARRPPILPKL